MYPTRMPYTSANPRSKMGQKAQKAIKKVRNKPFTASAYGQRFLYPEEHSPVVHNHFQRLLEIDKTLGVSRFVRRIRQKIELRK